MLNDTKTDNNNFTPFNFGYIQVDLWKKDSTSNALEEYNKST
ncbi:MAG: hypothetical protein ABF256_06550 [Candidatus Arcticimaribacter sp.]